MKKKRLHIDIPLKDFKTLEKLAKTEKQTMVHVVLESIRYYHEHNPLDIMLGRKKFKLSSFKTGDPYLSQKVDETVYGQTDFR